MSPIAIPPLSLHTLYKVGSGVEQIHSGETAAVHLPRTYPRDGSLRVCIACHGAGGDYHTGPHEKYLAGAWGIPVIATDLGGAYTWGNTTSLDRIDEIWAWAQAHLGSAADKFILTGGSMGSNTALRYLQERGANVARAAIQLTIADVKQIRDDNSPPGNFQSSIDAVWGIPTPDVARSVLNVASLIPHKDKLWQWVSNNDIYGNPTIARQLAADVGFGTTELGNVGHNYLSMSNLEYGKWLMHGAAA